MADLPALTPEAPYYLDSSGSMVQVTPDQTADAVAMGWTPAEPEQIASHLAQQKYGDTAGSLKAGAAAAARALTLGLSDQALTRTGLVAPETLQGLKDANPTADLIGTGIGIAAPLIATMGAAAPAEAGAQAAVRGAAELTAPSLVARAGQAVTRAVEAALPEAEGFLGRVVNRAVSTGAGSAIEGAAYGAGQVVSEQALGDPNLTAQSALATIGLSAALGGGLGAVLGIAHEAVPAAVTKTRDAISDVFGKVKSEVETWYGGAEGVHGVNPATAQLIIEHKLVMDELEHQAPGITQTLTTAPPATAASIIDNAGEFGALEREFPGVAKTLSKTRPDTLDVILKNPAEYANLEREFPGTLRQLSAAEPKTAQYLADNWRAIVRDPVERAHLAESVRKSGQSVIDTTDAMFKKAYGEMMRDGAEALLADANPQAILESYGKVWAKTADAIGEMEARPSLFDPYYPARLRVVLEDLVKDSDKVADPVTAFQRLTRLRQEIGDNVSWGKTALLSPAERDAQQLMKGIYRDISESLRSEEVFGSAGARKAELDEAFAGWKRLTERRPGAMLGKSEKGTSNFNFLLMQSGALSPNKMNQWFKHLADDTGALKTEAWSQMMDAARRAADAVESLHQAAPVTAFDRAAVTGLVDKTAQVTADAQRKFSVTQVMDQLNPKLARSMHEALAAAPQGAAASQVVNATQTVTGMMGHGPIIGTVKAVLSPIATAVETARSFPRGVAVLASLERMGQRIGNTIDAGASMLVRGSSRAETVGRAEVLAGVAREFNASTEDAVKRFNRRVTEIQRLSSDPEALHQTLVEQTEGLHPHAPNTAQALNIASARAVSFLAAKLPQHPQRGPLAPEWEPSRSEMAKFARYYEAVHDPLVILKQAAAGVLTPEAVEAVQVVYPELYGRIQQSLVEKIAGNRTAVPARSRIALSGILGQDLDGRLGMLNANQATYAAPSRKQDAAPQASNSIRPTSKGLGNLSLSQRSLTPMQATAQRRL